MGGGEVLLHKVLQDLNSHVWIINLDLKKQTFVKNLVLPSGQTQTEDRCTHRLNPVSYPHDQLSILLHLVDKLHGEHSTVKGFTELLCCSIQGASKTVPLTTTNGKNSFLKMPRGT